MPFSFDGTWLVLTYLTLLILIPSNRVVAALGSVGTPAALFSAGMLLIWAFLRVGGVLRVRTPRSPIHFALAGLALATLLSYLAAMNHALWEQEQTAADRGIIALLSWCGVFLVVADTVPNRQSLERVLKWLAMLIAVESAIAASQFFVGGDWVSSFSIPGLAVNVPIGAGERSSFFRVNGTGIHSIEFGVMAAIGLALTLHFALFGSSRRRWPWWIAFGITAAALPLTIARSAAVGAAIVLLLLIPTWPRAWQLRTIAIAPLAIVGLRLAFPGVLGTIWSMFTWLRQDSSATARLTDYEKVMDLLSPDPLFGRGIGTLLPELYFILDNQYMMALVTTGIVGLVALVALMGTAIATAAIVRTRLDEAAPRHLTLALLACVVVAAVTWLLFDGFSFAQASGTFWVILGCLAGLFRLTSAEVLPPPRPRGWRWEPRRLAARALPAAAVLLGVVTVLAPTAGKSGEYSAVDAYVIHEVTTRRGFFPDPYDTDKVANLLLTWLTDFQGREAVRELGGRSAFSVSQGAGSLAKPTERVGTGAVIRIRTTDARQERVAATQGATEAALTNRLTEMQEEVGAPSGTQLVLTQLLSTPEPAWQGGSRKRALAGVVSIAVTATGLFLMSRRVLTGARRRRRRGQARPSQTV